LDDEDNFTGIVDHNNALDDRSIALKS